MCSVILIRSFIPIPVFISFAADIILYVVKRLLCLQFCYSGYIFVEYTLSLKNVVANFLQQLHQLLTDLKTSFTVENSNLLYAKQK